MTNSHQDMPNEDLSDLGAPATPRGAGLAGLVGGECSTRTPRRDHRHRSADGTGRRPTPVRPVRSAPDATESTARGSRRQAGRAPEPSRSLRGIYTSAQASRRDSRRTGKSARRTNLQVVLEAISANTLTCRNRQRLHGSHCPGQSTVPGQPRARSATSEAAACRSASGPTADQEQVIDRIGSELGFETRSTWIAAVLNAFLPGRRDSAPTGPDEPPAAAGSQGGGVGRGPADSAAC